MEAQMQNLIEAIHTLTSAVMILAIIQFLHLMFKDTSGSSRLEDINKSIGCIDRTLDEIVTAIREFKHGLRG